MALKNIIIFAELYLWEIVNILTVQVYLKDCDVDSQNVFVCNFHLVRLYRLIVLLF